MQIITKKERKSSLLFLFFSFLLQFSSLSLYTTQYFESTMKNKQHLVNLSVYLNKDKRISSLCTIQTTIFQIKELDYEQSHGKDFSWLSFVTLDFIIFVIWVCIFLQTCSNSITLHWIPCICAFNFSFSSGKSSFSSSLQGKLVMDEELLAVWSKVLSLSCSEIRACMEDVDGNLMFSERFMQVSAESFS